MLGKHIKVDGVQYPNPSKFKINYKNNEVVNLSESYTELVSVNRLGKFETDMSFDVTSYWYGKILADCKKTSVSFSHNGIDYRGRMRITGADLQQYSETVSGTDGLWTLKVKFMEF